MNSRGRLSQNISASATKLRLDSLNKILKIDSNKSKKNKRDTIAKQVSRVALSELLKATPTNTQDIPDFKTFLSNKENVKEFREFLKTQYCQENIDFYLACEKYRQLDAEKVGTDLIKFMATQIFNDYLGENARQQVNINYDCLQNIRKQMRNPTANLLCDAQTEIFNLMRADCYPRFCKTWRLDRETAKKILCERPINSTPLNRTNNTITTMTTTSISGDLTASFMNSTLSSAMNTTQSRGTKRKIVPQSNLECPPDCPYYRVGLPCQQHNIDEENHIEQKGTSDLIDKIDLSRIHHVPNCCSRRSPPPPPLPPRPEQGKAELSPVINKKFCPYVGKVFNV